MTDEQIWDMIYDLIGEIDYDIQKSFAPECCEYEDPEELEDEKAKLIGIVKRHLIKGTDVC